MIWTAESTAHLIDGPLAVIILGSAPESHVWSRKSDGRGVTWKGPKISSTRSSPSVAQRPDQLSTAVTSMLASCKAARRCSSSARSSSLASSTACPR